MADILLRRGLKANVSNLVLRVGELALADDTGDLYAGTSAGLRHINALQALTPEATKLATARSFSITGDGTAAAINFDGTANVQLAMTLATIAGLNPGTYTKLTVNAKGQVTSGSTVQVADIGGIGTAASKNVGTSAGNVVLLDSQGLIPESVIPPLAVVDVHEAASQAAMLALTGVQKGDLCIRTDENKTYILKQVPASTLANWVLLRTPTDLVLSVNGKTGAVVLTKADLGLDKVANTTDAEKKVAEALKLTNQRAFSITGGATAAAINFDGTGGVALNVTSLDASKLTGTIDGGVF